MPGLLPGTESDAVLELASHTSGVGCQGGSSCRIPKLEISRSGKIQENNLFYFLNYFIVVQLQLSAFSPHCTSHPIQTHLLPLLPRSPLVLSMCPSWKPFSLLSPRPSPRAIVRLFLTSMSLVIFCLLFPSIYYVPVKGEIIWYLSLTAWLISLSMMLSSSIHAVAKGISSFFISAAENCIV